MIPPMSFYRTFRPALFALSPETAHNLSIAALGHGLVPSQPEFATPSLATSCFGLSFPNPIGLAAGFDKNATALPGLLQQGFGFIECGTVTPLAQPGNPKPRLFRLEQDEAIINRLGFNNAGLPPFINRLNNTPRSVPVGANIGMNKESESAVDDYVAGLESVYAVSDYITINISSPNTVGLRDLQSRHRLETLLDALLAKRVELAESNSRTVPLLLKIAPDLADEDVKDIAELLLAKQLDGCIVSNTTVDRPETLMNHHRREKGGLSGKPLLTPSTRTLKQVAQATQGQIPLIGVGGISCAADAYAKIRAGASLVQLYTALIYQGFDLVTQMKRDLATLLEKDGFSNITEAIGSDHR